MENLFQPLTISGMTLKNRIVFPPMTSNFAAEDGFVTQQLIDYYAERAAANVGLIIIEAAYPNTNGRRSKWNININDDKYIPGLTNLTSAVKKHGAKAALQLAHGGRECRRAITGGPPVAPSAVPSAFSGYGKGEEPRVLSISEIEDLIKDFGAAALRAKKAGFDAIEIHGAHGYLISQFLSPNVNFRTDKYGGDIRGRARFLEEVIKYCRVIVGADYPILARINSNDYIEDGLTLAEAVQVARIVEEAGADAIHVSAGVSASRPYYMIPGMTLPRGCNVAAAAQFKQAVKIPVIVAGRIADPLLASSILTENKADLISVGRGLIADPDWINKTKDKKVAQIRMCIACNEGCIRRLHESKPIGCAINLAAGREKEIQQALEKTTHPKKIVVVGGGPAGMETARTAALRGHKVTLYEESNTLGGLLKMAVIPPKREEINNLVKYYEAILPELGVEVKTGEIFTVATAKKLNPDTVVVASGGKINYPPIPGIQHPHVINALDFISGTAKAGTHCVVIGAGLVGIEVAEMLAEQNHHVMLVEMFDVTTDVHRSDLVYYQDKLAELKIDIHPRTKTVAIVDNSITVEENGWKKMILDIDTVILATGLKPDSSFADELRKFIPEVYAIGDCAVPGKILNAVHEATELASRI